MHLTAPHKVMTFDNTRSPDNYELTALDLRLLLTALAPDPDVAGQKYVDLQQRLRLFFEARHCRDAERAADVVLNRLVRKLQKENLPKPQGWAWRAAQFHWQEICEAESKRQDNEIIGPQGEIMNYLENQLTSPNQSDDALLKREPGKTVRESVRSQCLDRCLAQMKEPDRELLLAYQGVPPGQEKAAVRRLLAAQHGFTSERLRHQIHTWLNGLTRCVQECCQAEGE